MLLPEVMPSSSELLPRVSQRLTSNVRPVFSNDLSPLFPPHVPHPPPPPLNILPLQDYIHVMPLPRQLLITSHPMHERMTSPTQPRYLIQHMLFMPTSLEHFRMHSFRD